MDNEWVRRYRVKINEIIVVEGKEDTKALHRIADCDTIETNGSAVNEETLNKVRLALERRGVIIFTDPDYPGEKIRKTIDRAVPGCKHAFLPREQAIDRKKGKIGVEHASNEDLILALGNIRTPGMEAREEISKDDLLYAGLIAGPDSKQRREAIGQYLKIGYANGKQLHKRLIQFRISKAEFIEALESITRKEE
ncbi:ribonuclease M5 [Alteribacter populi]|uniref:ribonuclease M5 n=1 Tax=Alteribacter populi TaxID=2011011 RepID=UPI000BBA953F|nr:ribonuclease M5 [Alteribacter populi]